LAAAVPVTELVDSSSGTGRHARQVADTDSFVASGLLG
jgi:hypothetical protein